MHSSQNKANSSAELTSQINVERTLSPMLGLEARAYIRSRFLDRFKLNRIMGKRFNWINVKTSAGSSTIGRQESSIDHSRRHGRQTTHRPRLQDSPRVC